MRTFEQLAVQMDAFLDSVSPEELARKLMSHGVKFRNPPRKAAEEESSQVWFEMPELNERTCISSVRFEARSVTEKLSIFSSSMTDANSNELAIAA